MHSKTKIIFLSLILTLNVFLHPVVLAQTTPRDYGKAGVSDQIKKYLCAPTDASKDGGDTSLNFLGFGTQTNTASQNNSADGDLYLCINKLYRFAIAIASAISVFFIVIAGYVYMSAEGNAESVDKAKSILASSIVSLVILFSGYILLRAINPDLIKFGSIQPPSVTTLLKKATTTPSGSFIDFGLEKSPPVPAGAGGTCSESGRNFCVAATANCSNACSNYNTQIKNAAQKYPISGVANTEALLKAIMVAESSCNPSAASKASAYGLMQLKVETANLFKSACGINSTIDRVWLTNPNNTDAVLCIASKFLSTLAQGTCGTNIQNLAAGYNGGTKACEPSVSCSSEQGCSGQKRKWECLYDDPAHKTCNTGYTETRGYVPKILGCYKQNGG
jgi:hypothetical protein